MAGLVNEAALQVDLILRYVWPRRKGQGNHSSGSISFGNGSLGAHVLAKLALHAEAESRQNNKNLWSECN